MLFYHYSFLNVGRFKVKIKEKQQNCNTLINVWTKNIFNPDNCNLLITCYTHYFEVFPVIFRHQILITWLMAPLDVIMISPNVSIDLYFETSNFNKKYIYLCDLQIIILLGTSTSWKHPLTPFEFEPTNLGYKRTYYSKITRI